MGYLKSLFDGALAHGKDAWSKAKDDPERLFLGAMTPMGSELWGGITGKDYEPATTMWGGATEQQFQGMERQGIDTGPKRGMDAIADTIASFYAGGALNNVGGNLMGGGSAQPGGFMSQVQTGGVQGGSGPMQGGFMSQVDTGGPMMGGGSNPFMEMLNNMPNQQQQAPAPTPASLPQQRDVVRGPGSRMSEMQRALKEWQRQVAQERARQSSGARQRVYGGIS